MNALRNGIRCFCVLGERQRLRKHRCGQNHVVEHGQVAEQGLALSHESDGAIPQHGQCFIAQVGHIASSHAHGSRGRANQPSDHVDQRTFTVARPADDGDEFAGIDGEVHVADGVERRAAADELAGQVRQGQQMVRGGRLGYVRRIRRSRRVRLSWRGRLELGRLNRGRLKRRSCLSHITPPLAGSGRLRAGRDATWWPANR